MDETETPKATLGMPFVERWRAMQPIEQGRPWRWGADIGALQESLRDLGRSFADELKPAGAASVREAYETLSSAFQAKGGGDANKRVMLWVETFADWPLCALKGAVKRWSLRDTPFMPSPGQFHAAGNAEIEKRRADLEDVRHLLHIIDRPTDTDWDAFIPDPEVARKLNRLKEALKNGENVAELRRTGVL